MKERCFRVLSSALFLTAAGVAYGLFFLYTGIGVACPVNFLTGFQCPGCGVTHMCTALLKLDFESAFAANPVLLLLSPVLFLVFLNYIAGYVKTGRFEMKLWQNILLWICIVILILYGICRNIF